MTEAVIVLGAGAGLAAWILSPLRRGGVAERLPDTRRSELVEAKHAALRSILDLELDRSVGKVSDEDYRILRRQHEGEAVAIIAEIDEIDRLGSGGASSDVLEAEIAAARRRMSAPGGGE
jgi:hypothetical protein